jgi:hypothetical protein
MTDDKPHVVDGEHQYRRPQRLSDADLIRWVKSMSPEILRKKLTGPKAKEFSDNFSAAVKRETTKNGR